jgi:peroxiredoxin
MTRWIWIAALALAACSASATDASTTELTVGQVAPDFTLPDLDGGAVTLSAYRGKTVVLEWFNPGCPYVKDAHDPGGALDGLAAKAVADGVVWLAINSGAPGKQGHDVAENLQAKAAWAMAHPILRDENGSVGKAFGAATTPHVFVIDGQGVVQYEGAVDNQPMRQATGDKLPYLERALADLKAGNAVRTPRTKPWGCSVKY